MEFPCKKPFQHRNHRCLLFIEDCQRGGAFEQQASFPAFEYLADVVIGVLNGIALEIAFVRVNADSVDRSHPKPSGGVAEEVVYLVVGQSQRIVRADVLMIIVDVEFVEPSKSAYSDMSQRILFESVDFLVGKFIRNDDILFRRIFGGLNRAGTGGGCEQYKKNKA